jgi:hypothetical protein
MDQDQTALSRADTAGRLACGVESVRAYHVFALDVHNGYWRILRKFTPLIRCWRAGIYPAIYDDVI